MSGLIDIQVNGESRSVHTDLTIEGLVRSLDLHQRMIVVEHNGDILRHERYGEVRVSSGDQLELVHFVGGG